MVADTGTAPGSRSPAPDDLAGAAPHGPAVLAWFLRQQRRALVLWSFAIAAVSAIYVSFYPAMGDGGELQAMVDGMPEAVVAALGYGSIGTAPGYLESTVYGLLGPVLLLVFGLGVAARAIAGDEEDGSLELELSGPVARRRLLLERFAGLSAGLLLLCTVLGVVTVGLVAVLGMEVGARELVAATAGLFLLVLALSAVTFAAGAATGRRALALGIGAGIAVLAYIADALAPLIDDGRWLEALSPFSWYLGPEPLVAGWDLPGLLGLAAVTVVALGVAVVSFERRDLGV